MNPSALEEGALPFDKRADGQKGQAEGGDEGIAPRPLPEGEGGPHVQWPGIKDVADLPPLDADCAALSFLLW